MPLSEFLRLAIEKLEASKKKVCPDEPSSRDMENLPCNTTRVRDTGVGNAMGSRIGKFGCVESVFNDISPMVPSGNLDLSQDVEMVPWLNLDDSLPQYYCSEFLPKVAVTANGMSTQNSFVSEDKRSSCDQTVSNERNALKVPSSKACLLSSWLPQQGQISDPSSGSEVSDRISNCASKHPDTIFGSLVHGSNMLNDFKNVKMERQNMPSSNSSLSNVSHSRETTLVSANVPNLYGKDKGLASSGSHPVKSTLIKGLKNKQTNIDYHFPSAVVCSTVDSRLLVAKAAKGLFPADITENLCQKTFIKQNDLLIRSNTANSTNGVPDGEKNVEPVGVSSVGSDNSADGVSCEQAHNSKRKFSDMEDSECPSDDIETETESVGVQKATPTRGGSGSKSSRVAEVHNLSERRRRDRINEKMRALQELIPNCNKVDKASMLDEAIGYMKTLQLQVQIMSTGAGLHMPSMMFHAGFHHKHPTHMPHFSHRDVEMGMGMGIGYGVGMLEMNGGSSRHPIFTLPPVQGAPFHSPMSGTANFPRIVGSNLPACGHPSRGLPNLFPQVPFIPLTGWPPISSAMDSSASRTRSHIDVPSTTPILYCDDPIRNKNSQPMQNAEVSISINHRFNQLQSTNELVDQPALVQENNQARGVSGSEALSSSIATDSNKEAGCE